MAVLGGVIIGLSATLLLLFLGRIAGISGILGGLLKAEQQDKFWRFSFLFGLISGGLLLKAFYPQAFELKTDGNTFDFILAGLLVGVGTQLGSGCTSGHGVCGMSRLSKRSIISTFLFIGSGILSVLIFKMVRG